MASEIADLYVTLRAETRPLLSGFRSAAEEGEAFGGKMSGPLGMLSKIGVAAGAVGLGVAVASVKMAGDFEAGMQKLVTTAGESQGALRMVSDGVLQLARDTGTSTKDLSDGMYMVESAGFHASDGLTVLKAAAEGARAEQAPLADVSNAVTSALKSYHLGADQATTITNQMISAVGHGKMTFSEFSGSLSTVLPIASSAGLSFAQVGGAIATLTNHGTSAREATQELANTIRNLQAPNNVAVQEMQRLGLSSVDISTKLGERGLTGTIQQLQQAVIQHMGPAGTVMLNTLNTSKQASADLQQMLGAMQGPVKGLAQQLQSGTISVGDYTKAIKSLPAEQYTLGAGFESLFNKTNGFNSLLKSGGPAVQTYDDAMKKMMGGATGLNTALMLGGENMIDFTANVQAVGDAGKGAGKDVEGWAGVQKTFNFQLSQLKETVITLAIKLGESLMPYAEKFMGWVKDGIEWLTKHRSVLLAVAGAIGTTLVAAIVSAGAAMVASFGWVEVIVLGVMAVGAALVYAYTHFRAFRTVVDEVGSVLKAVFVGAWHAAGAVISWFQTSVLPPARAAISALIAWFNGHSSEFSAAWRLVMQEVHGLVKWFDDNVLKWVRERLSELIKWWGEHSQEIHQVWSTALKLAETAFKVFWDGFLRPGIAELTAVWRVAWGLVADSVKIAWALVSGVVMTGIHWVENVIGLGLDLITGKWGKIWGDLSHMVGQALSDVTSTIGNVVSGFGTLLWNAGANIIKGLISGIKSGIGSVKNVLSDLTSSITSWKGPPEKDAVLLAPAGRSIMDGLMAGIATRVPQLQGQLQGITTRIAGSMNVPPSAMGLATGSGALPVGSSSGGYGGNTTVVNNHFHIQGSVLSERDLRDVVEQQMYRLGMRGSTTWQNYERR